MTAAFLMALGLIFAAEMGDKTQLLVLAFATRFSPLPVLLGVLGGAAGVSILSAALGTAVGHVLPLFWINVAAGLAFIGFGLWTLRGEEEDEETGTSAQLRRFGPFATVLFTFFLAELGDKTMLATITIASREQHIVAVWLGATMGMFLANVVAIIVGRVLGTHLPERPLRWGAAAIFILSGLWILGATLLPMLER